MVLANIKKNQLCRKNYARGISDGDTEAFPPLRRRYAKGISQKKLLKIEGPHRRTGGAGLPCPAGARRSRGAWGLAPNRKRMHAHLIEIAPA